MTKLAKKVMRILNICIVLFIPFIPYIIPPPRESPYTDLEFLIALYRVYFIIPAIFLASIVVLVRQKLGSTLYLGETGDQRKPFSPGFWFWIIKLGICIVGFGSCLPIFWSGVEPFYSNYRICYDASIWILPLLFTGVADWCVHQWPVIREEMTSGHALPVRLLLTLKTLLFSGIAARKHKLHKLLYAVRILCWIPIVLAYLAGLRDLIFMRGLIVYRYSPIEYFFYWGSIIVNPFGFLAIGFPAYIPLVVLRLAELVFFDRD